MSSESPSVAVEMSGVSSSPPPPAASATSATSATSAAAAASSNNSNTETPLFTKRPESSPRSTEAPQRSPTSQTTPRSPKSPERKREEVNKARKEMFIYFSFLIIFVAWSTSLYDEDSYYQSDRFQATVLHRNFQPSTDNQQLTFFDIGAVDKLYYWMKNVLFDTILVEKFDNAQPQNSTDRYYAGLQNKAFGKIRIRQLRVRPNLCTVRSDFASIIPTCWEEYSIANEDKTSFGPTSNPTKYKYMPDAQTKEMVWFGKLGFYEKGGFVVDLPLSLSNASAVVDDLQADRFIDRATRVVMVDCNLYNPSANLFLTARFAFEFGHTGGVRPKADLSPLILHRYTQTAGGVRIFLESAICFFVLYYIVEEGIEMHRSGFSDYFQDKWNIADWLNIILFLLLAIIRIYSEVWLSQNFTTNNLDNFIPLGAIALLNDVERFVAGSNGFLLWFKIFKYLRFWKRLSNMFSLFETAARNLVFFGVVFIIFFLGLANCGYLFFYPDVIDFRSFSISIVALIKFLLGGLDVDDLTSSNRVLGPIFAIFYSVVVLLVLINFFLAILNDAFSKVQNKAENDKLLDEDITLADIFPFISNFVDDADTDKDGKVSKAELVAKLVRDGLEHSVALEHVDKVFSKFDTNDDGNLSAREAKNLEEAAKDSALKAQMTVGQKQIENLLSEKSLKFKSKLEDLRAMLNAPKP